ncbi:MAG TPA: glucose 1-dehydrogenase [Vineibacter sp.]|nr:glucose 1-dehydrogenase [Vineibacter sp.]
MSRLDGKVALVTGGGRGIGAAIARRLAEDGADVALTYLSSPYRAQEVVVAIEDIGRRAKAYAVDSADPAAVRAAVDQALADFDRLDILVNNAGIHIAKPLSDFTLDDFERIVAVNVRAVFVATQAAAPHLRDGGRIISIGSVNADHAPAPNTGLYAMSKSALIGLTKGLARDLGPLGVTINLVHPGPIDTDLNPADGPFADTLRGMLAIPRYAAPNEVAGLVAWLASAESAFVTGATLTIDGGYTA